MKPSKTVFFGTLVIIASPLIEYLAQVDWTEFGLSPKAGVIIGSMIIVLRAMTKTPLFK